MIETSAPGKLFVAGEYAVVEPGRPSVLVAVDRFLTVRLSPSEREGRVHSAEYGRSPRVWSREDDGERIVIEHEPADYVMSAIATIDALRAARGLPPHVFDLHISSELDDADGRKFGLGSSAAVTVAVVAALDELYDLSLPRTDRFKVALLATIAISPNASGGDLASSTFGGWVRYAAPDRARLAASVADRGVAATLGDDDAWAGLSIGHVVPPPGLQLHVGWTGAPASTERLVRGVRGVPGTHEPRRRSAAEYAAFLDDSAACVADLIASFARGDAAGALAAIRRNRSLLQRLGEATGTEIETPALRALCESAEAIGAAGKPSGAGGGDCGIVLATGDHDTDAMLRVWREQGIRHLDLSVHAAEPDAAGRVEAGLTAADLGGTFGGDDGR
ncbi:MAG: phosphomevalonate kinase [Pseudoclavibacter sp.]